MNVAITNEKKDSKTTWELETDLTDLKKMFDQLEALLQNMETKEVDDGSKLRKTIRKGYPR